jgi:hypothetical protein
MSTDLTPAFILSLPRTGSTLVQRVLAAHKDVATVAEPHILLHFLVSLREEGTYSTHAHRRKVKGCQDFCEALPNGPDDYLAELRAFTLRLYSKAAKGGAKYFVDKTSTYSLIAEDIINLFPNGKFIFLWRNPLSVVSSIMKTFASGRWNLWLFEIDLFEGFTHLVAAYEKHKARVCAIRYEDLISGSEKEWQRMFAYLELPFDVEVLSRFADVQLEGRILDPTLGQYQALSQEPLEKWKLGLTNPIRKAWCRGYLRWIGKERLAVMGYDLDELLAELDALPFSLRYAGSDMWRIPYGIAYKILEPQIMKQKLRALLAGKRIYVHT